MTGVTVQEMAGQVADLMEARLGLRGDGLAAKLRRGRRVLPRNVRREAEYLVRAAEKAHLPKLQVQLDRARIDSAFEICMGHLKPLGVKARRRALFLDMLTGFGTAVFAVIVLVVIVLAWRAQG
ncbi:MAG: hypothetical protein WBB85_17745 [Albidovulum sp.]|uniref:hypothetical protein n=1 Tax=Albidovulum sp. TaxID=1872424 RepID=UPI003C96BF5F